ncbi:phage baseplate assembly protein V [Erwinia pyrifoliae]|uniref:phage baseplate assembly protein V n=1 Tax=Erwinia pyrifoliae TaxID=79967 RepID=UPI0022090F2D|nr:phage baseplate assembly protein V [Erwinia pyrifoliae]UWS30971.1 phage baseplate assembly protein V [Erwinia pyrifoliae]
MKTIKRLYLSGDVVHMVDVNIALELNACGRGFITAQTEKDYTGKLVRLDVGYDGLVLRWFTGYVERSQPSENGFQRLFVRELVGVFDKLWPCSFQHPTLREILRWISEQSGLAAAAPSGADYADRPIPHFTHSGTGYQLFASLGKSFSVPDYLWYQLPDGAIFAGAARDSMFAGKPVEVPAEFSQGNAAGNSMMLPLIQSLRPCAEVNGQRLTHVRLCNDDMEIKWTPRNKSTGQPLQKSPFQRQAESAFPELASGLHLPKFARVEAPSEEVAAGNIADPYRPRFAVDLQLLDADGNPAKDTPVYPAVPLPVPMAGSESGMFNFPPPGTLVEIGFAEGRPDKPFVRQTMPQGNGLPAIKPGEQLQQHRDGVSQRVTVAGDWQRQTDQTISESSMRREIHADEEARRLIARETTIQATDKTTVLGTAKLLAGGVAHISEGDYSIATGGKLNVTCGKGSAVHIGQNAELEVGASLTEKITGIRRSVAAAQQIVAPVINIGNGEINLLSLLTDTLDVINQLATLAANHTHPDTGQSQQAGQFSATAQNAVALKAKYGPLID